MIETEYEWRKDLIERERRAKKEVSEYIRETEKLKHEWELTRMRIKSAEIKRSQERKQNIRFLEESNQKEFPKYR